MQRKKLVPRRFAKKKGMTLIELMIALTILAIGLLALMGLILTATATNSLTCNGTRALDRPGISMKQPPMRQKARNAAMTTLCERTLTIWSRAP